MSNRRIKENVSEKHLTEEQIFSYHQGKMKEAEMHSLEMHLLQCEFCKDAVEGMSLIHPQETESILKDLRGELLQKTEAKGIRTITTWRIGIAASIALLMGLGLVFWYGNPAEERSESVAQRNNVPDSIVNGPEVQYNDKQYTFTPKNEPPSPAISKPADESEIVQENKRNSSLPSKKNNNNLSEGESVAEEFAADYVTESEERISAKASAQEAITISGKVTDELGQPLAGTSVSVAGTNNSTVTNAEGNYTISAPSHQDTLIFNTLGYTTYASAVDKSKSQVNPILQFDSSALSMVTLAKPANEINKESNAFAAPNAPLKTKKPMITAQGNSKQISGTVLSKAGEPLPGVSVQIKGTASGVLTDQNGNYSLPLPAPSTNLVFSHIGYSTEELVINSPNVTGDIVLEEDVSALSEVVIVGRKSRKDNKAKSMSPLPVIGMTAFKKYLKENVKYTPTAREKGIEGTVVVEFLVRDNGDITDLVVKEGLGYGLDEEAIRLIESGPRWIAGSKSNQVEKQKVVVKIPFTLK